MSSSLEFLRYSKIKFKAVVKHDLIPVLWCEAFKDVARTTSLGHACYAFDCKLFHLYIISVVLWFPKLTIVKLSLTESFLFL